MLSLDIYCRTTSLRLMIQWLAFLICVLVIHSLPVKWDEGLDGM